MPGLKKLRKLYEAKFFGRIISIRLDFGWWVFDGELFPAQRPSWNYRKEGGGGLVLDMFAHWRYIFDRLLGPITAVSCRHMTATPTRIDESGRHYEVDVEDHAFAMFELEGGVLAQVASSWVNRVKRDDLLQIQVDGTQGSAVAGLHRCYIQPAAATPRPFFSPELPQTMVSANNGRRCPTSSRSRTATCRLETVPAPCRRGRAVSRAAPRRRKKRPARRRVLPEPPRTPLGGVVGAALAALTSAAIVAASRKTRNPGDRALIIPASITRRRILQLASAAGTLALIRAPAFAQAAPKKLIFAHVTAKPKSSAVAFAAMAKEVTERSKGELAMEFHGGTLLTKELEIINAVKAGNIAMGDPGGAAATVFPEMGVFLVPYLVASYAQAYKMFNGEIGARLDKTIQDKYKLKVLFFYDYGFRHFWNSKRPIVETKDLRGLKLRVQPAKVFADTINGLGGIAVPMAWGEVDSGGAAGRHRRRRPADRQYPGVEGLRGLEILLDDLPQLRADRGRHEPRHLARAERPAAEAHWRTRRTTPR